MSTKELTAISGHVQKIIFAKEPFFIFQLEDAKKRTKLVTGNTASLKEGSYVKVQGEFTEHPRYGQQMKASTIEITMPEGSDEMLKYLQSGAFKGLGPKLAKAIVDYFGPDTREIVENDPKRLMEVPKIGKKKAQAIIDSLEDQLGVSRLIAMLAGLDVTMKKSIAIAEHFGVKSISKAREVYEQIMRNPYQLTEIRGIGFKTVDVYALASGIAKDSPFRVSSGILHVIEDETGSGHTGIRTHELLSKTNLLLAVEISIIEKTLGELVGLDKLIIDKINGSEECVFSPKLYRQEQEIAKKISKLVNYGVSPLELLDDPDWESKLSGFKANDKGKAISISKGQEDAIKQVMAYGVGIITGGPGMGKTTLVKVLIDLLEKNDCKVLMAAPTGKAAKRASESIGRDVVTIHRLLEFSGEGFGRNELNPIEADVVIVDEASMFDIPLANAFFKAISTRTAVLLVGDIDQLPSVGPGKVLKDLIDSGVVGIGQLTEVFRQALDSKIISAAYQVNNGSTPEKIDTKDFAYRTVEAGMNAPAMVKIAIREALDTFGYLADEIQILAPMKKGPAGTEAMNKLGQELLNPGSIPTNFFRNGFEFRIGDRVMQTRNDYNKEVFNGEIGKIIDIVPKDDFVVVKYPDKGAIIYARAEVDDLIMAFASTVHRFQGSEAPCVIMPLLTSHYVMLKRNMLYTGITRASKRFVLIGDRRAVRMAVDTIDGKQRVTKLKDFLIA